MHRCFGLALVGVARLCVVLRCPALPCVATRGITQLYFGLALVGCYVVHTAELTNEPRPAVAGMRFLKPDEVMPALGFAPSETKNFWAFVWSEGVPCTRLNRRRLVFEEAAFRSWIASRTSGKLSVP